jgi:hypothetical protein
MVRYQFHQTNRSIREMARMLDEGYFVTDQDYQRDLVWTHEDKLALIASVQSGIPIGALYLNAREGASSAQLHVVDGKQRLTTLLAFFNDELAAPADWFYDPHDHMPVLRDGAAPDADGNIRFSDLAPGMQTEFALMNTIAVYETTLPTEADERVLFDRINFSGVRHLNRASDS